MEWRQVLSNLLSNAVKFTNEGEINIGLEMDDKAGFKITVSDTGVGVAPDKQKEIFESFRQADNSRSREYEGTGLGLAICNKITHALGGKMTMESVPDAGTSFTVVIPAKRYFHTEETQENAMQAPQIAVTHLTPEEEQAALAGLSVLVAEDNANNALLIQAMLKGRVGNVETVVNGAEALKAVQVRNFDVILMDKRMPVMDGIEASKSIRSLPLPCHTIPIIAITADLFAGSREEILSNGMDECIVKPVDANELYSVIAKCVSAERTALAS